MYYRRKLTCECSECNRNRKAGAEREETMNQYITAAVIKELREKHQMTQLQLAQKLGVSDKAISKWETGVSLS